jgi:SAM-dependent methyltransferase
MTTRTTPDDVLGVPAMPPGAVTVTGNRVRALVGRLQRAMAPPPVRILEGALGLLDHRVLVALCDAGVPEALTGPTTVAELAGRIGADETMLERLLRFAATRGWVRIDRRGRVRPTRVTAFLRADHPGGWRSWVDFVGGEEVVAAVAALSVRGDAPDGFAAANGASFFEWMADHPERWRTFDRAMAAGARMHALGLSAALDWSAGERVCDVGGGTGTLLATLLDLEPGVEGTVLDLPDVVARAVEHPRLTATAGDAFEHLPEGFDTYLFVNVLHDWSDDDAMRLLTRAAEVLDAGARVVVVDSDRPTIPHDDVSVLADVLMAALTAGGKERDTEAFAALGRAAGLRLHRSVRLASADLAHVYRRSDVAIPSPNR